MEKKSQLKIAGIVTLYYPSTEDINNINTYINDIDVLYVIDNTPDTNNKQRLPKNKKLIYILNNANLGVAKALNLGAQRAIQENYEWLLTMDQDTTLSKNIINDMKMALLKEDVSKIGIITPWHKTKLIDSKPTENIDFPNDVMTSGNLLNLNIYKKIGGFKDWLFIDGIDIDYCYNLKKNGYKIMRLNNLEIKHNLGDIKYKKIFGKNILSTNHNYIRRYYMARNYLYLRDFYYNLNPDYFKILGRQKRNILKILLFEKDKYRKIKSIFQGMLDYKIGKKNRY